MLAADGPFSPCILAAGDGQRPFAWRKPRRVLPFHLLVCSLDGPETVQLDDACLAIPPGGCYALPAGTAHALASPGNRPVFVHLELAWHPGRWRNGWERFPVPPGLGRDPARRQPGWAETLGTDLPLRPPPVREAALRHALPRLVSGWLAGGPRARTAAGLELGSLLLAWANEAADAPADRLARAEQAGRAGLAGGAGLAAMAAAAGLGRSRFCALFRAHRGRSPGAWLRSERLQRACELLAETDLPLSDIAARVGCADAPGLVRLFRAAGLGTPGAWRARAQQWQSASARQDARP